MFNQKLKKEILELRASIEGRELPFSGVRIGGLKQDNAGLQVQIRELNLLVKKQQALLNELIDYVYSRKENK